MSFQNCVQRAAIFSSNRVEMKAHMGASGGGWRSVFLGAGAHSRSHAPACSVREMAVPVVKSSA